MFRNIADIENPSDQGVRFDVPPDRLDFQYLQYFETFYSHEKCDYVEKK